jgi:DNA-binding Lrp family transcriptional regulator
VDAYVLLQTEPGLASTVMNALVEGNVVNRALCITGEADVFARINNVDWAELKDRLLNRLQRVPGVVRSSTHVVVPTAAVVRGMGPKHPVYMELSPSAVDALVFVRIAPGSARETVRALNETKGVLGLAVVTGGVDLIVQVTSRSIEQLATTVLQQIHTIPGVTSTKTSLILTATPLRDGGARARKGTRKTTRKTTRKAARKPVRRRRR